MPVPDGRLARLAPRTITSRAALARDLERVRERGWAAAVDELEAGLAAVGAPVHAAGGAVVAALTLSGPTVRIGDDRLDELGAPGRAGGLRPLRTARRARWEGGSVMTEDEILKALYDETLVGNAPRVLELTNAGARAWAWARRRCSSTR